jgi:hypothetical protein
MNAKINAKSCVNGTVRMLSTRSRVHVIHFDPHKKSCDRSPVCSCWLLRGVSSVRPPFQISLPSLRLSAESPIASWVVDPTSSASLPWTHDLPVWTLRCQPCRRSRNACDFSKLTKSDHFDRICHWVTASDRRCIKYDCSMRPTPKWTFGSHSIVIRRLGTRSTSYES